MRRKYILKQGSCAVCGNTVMVDEIGNGEKCVNCGWIQDAAAIELPHQVSMTNRIRLVKARELYGEGKPLAPDFYDAIEFCETYGDIAFIYSNTRYCIAKCDNGTFMLYRCGSEMKNLGEYGFDEFAEKANIGGTLLKDLWDRIGEFSWVF